MTLTQKEIKQRYFDKVYANAEEVECACGCGKKIKNKDRYGRDKKYVSGHNNRKYDDPTQYKREWNHRNRKSRYRYKMDYGRKRKAVLIKLLGNKCTVCKVEYNGKNASMLQFHHRNPDTKKYCITVGALVDRAWSDIIEESKKCDLICANCHFLKHSKEY